VFRRVELEEGGVTTTLRLRRKRVKWGAKGNTARNAWKADVSIINFVVGKLCIGGNDLKHGMVGKKMVRTANGRGCISGKSIRR